MQSVLRDAEQEERHETVQREEGEEEDYAQAQVYRVRFCSHSLHLIWESWRRVNCSPDKEKKKAAQATKTDENCVGLRAQLTKTPSYAEFDPQLSAGLNVSFHLAATINSNTGESSY